MKLLRLISVGVLLLFVGLGLAQKECPCCPGSNHTLIGPGTDNNFPIVTTPSGEQILCKYPVHNLMATPNCSSPVLADIDGNRYIDTSNTSHATATMKWGIDAPSLSEIVRMGNATPEKIFDFNRGSTYQESPILDQSWIISGPLSYIRVFPHATPSLITLSESPATSNWSSVYGSFVNASFCLDSVPEIILNTSSWTYSSWSRGHHDAVLIDIGRGSAAYARNCVNKSEIDISLFPDANIMQSSSGNTPADFVVAIRHAVQVLRANGGTNIKFVLTFAVPRNGETLPHLNQFYPGDGYVDYFQADMLFGAVLDPKPNWLMDSNVQSLFSSLTGLNRSKRIILDIGIPAEMTETDRCNCTNIDPQEVIEMFPQTHTILFSLGSYWDHINESSCLKGFIQAFSLNPVVLKG